MRSRPSPPHRLAPRAWAVAALVALAAPLAACGGGGAGDDGRGLPETADELSRREGLHGRAPAAQGGIPAVVLLHPLGGGSLPPDTARLRAPVIDQFGLSFSPKLLVVDVGTPITFTNSEGALTHNVNLRSVDRRESVFNEDANSGDRIQTTLTEPGGYDVLCDMHPGMAAFVFVTDAPYTVFADADGSFTMGFVPPGMYAIRSWTRDVGYGPVDTVSVAGSFTEVDLSGLR